MSDEYTPDREVIWKAYEYYSAGCGGVDRAEFDRFIAKERSEAWVEGVTTRDKCTIDQSLWPLEDWLTDNPYRKDSE